MGRGVLEVLAHYKTVSHLVREHRIRMDTPGMPSYDKNGHELQGLALSEAKKVAKETYPFVPQLDPYRLLVGQDSLPKFGAEKSPMETVISQICLLEIGLRRDDVSCLSDISEEVNRFSSEGGHTNTFDWSPHQLFVIILPYFNIHICSLGMSTCTLICTHIIRSVKWEFLCNNF